MLNQRDSLGSRIGFLLLAAGCAIGMGNVWRFPYVTGQYGGAFFLCFYLIFLIILGFPIMLAELSIGRAGQSGLTGALRNLKNPNNRIPWQLSGHIGIVGALILLMFYTSVTGWLLYYTVQFALGRFSDIGIAEVPELFGKMIGNWKIVTTYAFISILLSSIVCAIGLKSSLERVTKFMMLGLFAMMMFLVVTACSLPKAVDGLKFFLMPNLENLRANGIGGAIHAAMTQAFFTLSLGIGSIAIFGSYIKKEKTLGTEAICIIVLDTFVAICAGLIIFPCCFAYDVAPGAGPSLIFITLPKIFLGMSHGALVGTIFFLFMTTAAMTTLMAVEEALIAYCMDEWKMKRATSALLSGVVLAIGSMPCILGFNLWSSFQPFGEGSCVLDLEDFIVSDNLLPLGSLVLCIFCTRAFGWGKDNFMAEVNAGNGLKVKNIMAFYMKYVLPVLIIAIWIIGIYKKFF